MQLVKAEVSAEILRTVVPLQSLADLAVRLEHGCPELSGMAAIPAPEGRTTSRGSITCNGCPPAIAVKSVQLLMQRIRARFTTLTLTPDSEPIAHGHGP